MFRQSFFADFFNINVSNLGKAAGKTISNRYSMFLLGFISL